MGRVCDGVCGVPHLAMVRLVLNVTVWSHKHIKHQRQGLIILYTHTQSTTGIETQCIRSH